jgi:ABC-2 type transport system permease protein
MILSIARAEWRLITRRRSYPLLLVLFVLILGLAAVLSNLRQSREHGQQARYQALVRAQWEEQPGRHPHRVAHYGTFAFKPVGVLAAFDPGVETYSGRVQFLEAHRQNASNFAEAGALSSAFRLGELSPAFVLHCLLPLLVIVLGHRLIADDVESGRARLLLAQGASPGALVAGKALGLALALLPFLIAAAAITLVAIRSFPAIADVPVGGRLALIGATVGLHVGSWLAITVWFSTRARTAARALGGLVALWGATCIVIPRATAAMVAAVEPLPTKGEFDARLAQEIEALGDTHDPHDPTFSRLRSETLDRYDVTRVEDLPINYGAVVMARGEQLSAELFARHFGELTALMERQDTWVRRAALVSPLLGVRGLTAAASGTDLGALVKFQKDAEAYRYEFVQQLNALHRDKIRFVNDRDQRLTADHWAAIPDFVTKTPPLRDALKGTGWAWLAMALWVVVPTLALRREGIKP